MDLRTRATRYFQLAQPLEEFWRWDRETFAVRWIDGVEIVSRQELVNFLRQLAPQGLPFFPALVYLIAACRGKTVEVIWHEPDAATMRSERMPCTLKSVGKEVRQSASTPVLAAAAKSIFSGFPVGVSISDCSARLVPRPFPEFLFIVLTKTQSPRTGANRSATEVSP